MTLPRVLNSSILARSELENGKGCAAASEEVPSSLLPEAR
jgi:hypothetical protein